MDLTVLLPALTSVLAAAFALGLSDQWRERRDAYQLVWGLGMGFFAVAAGAEGIAHHLCAVTTAVEAAAAFGVPADAVFGFRDWVGGRFSLASAVISHTAAARRCRFTLDTLKPWRTPRDERSLPHSKSVRKSRACKRD